MIKSGEVILNSPYDISNALSQLSVFDLISVKRIEITRMDEYSNRFFVTVFLE